MLPADGFEGGFWNLDFGFKDWGDGLFAFIDSATSSVARGDTGVRDFATSSVGRGTRHAVSLRLHQPYGGHRDLCPGNHRVSMSVSGKEDGG